MVYEVRSLHHLFVVIMGTSGEMVYEVRSVRHLLVVELSGEMVSEVR